MFTADMGENFAWRSGWMLKLNNGGDSLWFRYYDNIHDGFYDKNYLYDVVPTTDHGFAACGEVWGEVTGNAQHAWAIKVDSMGCDTPGCATGVFVREIYPYEREHGEELTIYPNPARDWVTLSLSKCAAGRGEAGAITIYDPQGIKAEEIKIPKNAGSIEVDVSSYRVGLYYLQYARLGQIVETVKFIKN
jgi:hypothetical protein